MTTLLQAAPLLALLVLLGSGRVGPVPAVLLALPLALLAGALSLPAPAALPGFLVGELPRALFLALQPVAVVAGGLLFQAALPRPDPDATAPRLPTAARVFAVTLPMGAFLESITGFAVGALFALAALRAMGLRGPVAGALALQALVLVPWGGLGPGTTVGAALAQLPPGVLAGYAAAPTAGWLLLLAPVLWWLCGRAGVAVPAAEKLAQLVMLGALGALLVLASRFLPWELAGLLSTGPVMLVALFRADPPRDLPAALRRASPYLVLTAALLAARSWHGAPAWHPFEGLPAFPLTHVAVVLWVVAGGLLLGQPDRVARVAAALGRARRPAVAMVLYILLGRVMAGSGAAAALAGALAAALGPAAPLAIAPMALVAGMVTGSNVGSNAALMPLQVALGAAAGLPPGLAAGLHNFAGSAGSGMSVGVLALVCGLLADGTRPVQLWRLLWPSMLAVLAVATAALLAWR